MIESLGVSTRCYEFIQDPSQEKREALAKNVSEIINSSLQNIFESLSEKEGKKNDSKTIDHFAKYYGRDAVLLTFRILDDLMIKECRIQSATNSAIDMSDLTELITKESFIKSILTCAIECIFFINIVKSITIHDILIIINLKPFDFWRLLNSFIRFDPHMPLSLVSHFREIEIKVVNETAWTPDSPIVVHINSIQA